MPFSASTCITNLGSTPLGPILSAYTDTDSYLNPFSSVNTSQINGVNCPYVFTNIPDGTTNIRLIDTTNSCCITIPIQSDNFCNTCDLDFNYYPLQTNSQILAGNLTGSCQANISDYVINWYGPNSATNIAFRSGKGNTFSYQFTHPLTGTGFIFAQAGNYTPVIDRVIISGITFSHTGGTGTYDATLDCFNSSSVQVNPLTCDNGNTPTSAYTHTYSFSGTGATSIPLNVTFQLSANTNYFAYSFSGYDVPDTIKITYSGANTNPNQLILENISVGTDPTNATQLNYGAPIRKTQTSSYSRVLCLTGITRSAGDNLTIQITPNPGNTRWELGLRCFSTFSCSNCVSNNFINTPIKIVTSAITIAPDFNNCRALYSIYVSGCTLSSVSATNVYKYYSKTPTGNNFFDARPAITLGSGNFNNILVLQNYFTNLSSNCSTPQQFGSVPSCRTNTTPGTITFNRYLSGTPSVYYLDIISTNPEHIQYFYSQYLSSISSSQFWGLSACTGQPYPNSSPTNNGPWTGGTWTGTSTSITDPTDRRYYRTIKITVPTATGATSCGNNNNIEVGGTGFIGNQSPGLFQILHFHTSVVPTTGTSGSSFYFRIIPKTITPNINFTICQVNCQTSVDTVVGFINNAATGATAVGNGTNINGNFSFTNTVGAMVNNAVAPGTGAGIESCTPSSAATNGIYTSFNDYQEYTFPTSTANVIVPQYSGAVCNWPRYSPAILNPNVIQTGLFLSHGTYKVELLPTSNFSDYRIYVAGVQNFKISGNTNSNQSTELSNIFDLAYTFQGGVATYSNPAYMI